MENAIVAEAAEAIAAHRSWVGIYNGLVRVASCEYPSPLSEDAKDAYLAIPAAIDNCKEAFERIPEAARPVHYLLHV